MSHEKVALVTGSAKRVGKAIVLKLHKKQYRVIIHCNSSKDLANKLAEEINSVKPNTAYVISGDLGQNVEATCKNLIEEAHSHWGRLDVLVNNASAFPQTVFGEMTEKSWDLVMNPNAKAPVLLAQAAYPYLKKTNGCIVNMCDALGERPNYTQLEYCISKGALITATKALALVSGPEVRVNGVAPGAVDWPEVDLDYHNNEFRKAYMERTALKRIGLPEEAADAVVFLASPESSFITGHVLKVDGGRTTEL